VYTWLSFLLHKLVTVDATSQGNTAVRAGPLPAPNSKTGGWDMHVYCDHSIIEVIVNNATALVVYAAPASNMGYTKLVGEFSAGQAHLDLWELASANNQQL
jgi:hypothetical protein